MKYLTKAGIFGLCLCMAYALYVFLDMESAAAETKTYAQVENANRSEGEDIKSYTDITTGFPAVAYGSNSIIYTSEISYDQSKKLIEHFKGTSFFTSHSSNTIIIGKEPNNYVLFYQLNTSDSIPYLQLQAFAVGISANVFNHRPVVVKIINEEKDVVRIVTSL